MSLQGPARRRCVRMGAHFRRPCILFFLATTWSSPTFAGCHIYKVWHYPKPQRCFTAYAPRHILPRPARHEAGFVPVNESAPVRERIEVILPPVAFEPCPEGDEHLVGIAKLRALMDAR